MLKLNYLFIYLFLKTWQLYHLDIFYFMPKINSKLILIQKWIR